MRVQLATLYASIAVGGNRRRTFLVVIGVVAALPTLVWAVNGAAFLHDDWNLAYTYRGGPADFAREFWHGATRAPGRPGAAAYYTITYALFGAHPVLHALVQAALNSALGVLVFITAERLWRTEIACWVALVYVTLPNRGSTRLWAAVATNPLAVILVLVAVLLLLRGRVITAGLILGLAVLTYEGVVGLAFLALLYWLMGDISHRWRRTAAAAIPVLVCAAAIFTLSPKRDGGPGSDLSIPMTDRLLSSQFGVGVFEWPTLTLIGLVVVLVSVAVILASRGARERRYRPVLLGGFAVLLAAAAPYVLVRWPIGTEGFFDRANGVVGLGTAVIFGVVLAWFVDLVPARIGAIPAVAIVVVFLGLNAIDVRAYRDATAQGREILSRVLVDIPPSDNVTRVWPPPETHDGLAEFPDGSNLSNAVFAERGNWQGFWILPEAEQGDPPPGARCYDVNTRLVTDCPPESDEADSSP